MASQTVYAILLPYDYDYTNRIYYYNFPAFVSLTGRRMLTELESASLFFLFVFSILCIFHSTFIPANAVTAITPCFLHPFALLVC